MPTARKLPSGSWHCIMFAGYDTDGKRIYKSFTVKDKSRNGKKECERLASEWAAHRPDPYNPTVREAVQNYIELKRAVLSPSTIRGYELYLKRIEPIGNYALTELDNATAQKWVNGLSADYSPKYIKNVVGLLQSVLTYYVNRRIKVTLPSTAPPALYTPCDADIALLLDYIGNRPQLLTACLLAAFGGLRRGEICALQSNDIDGNEIRINKSMVRDSIGVWHIKPTAKTDKSNRIAIIPDFVTDFVTLPIGIHPEQLSNRFRRAVASCGCAQHFRFHDLRHYYVSIAHALGVPDAYIMRMGGWKTDAVMKRVYRDALPDVMQAEQDKLTNHFAKRFAYPADNIKNAHEKHDKHAFSRACILPAVGLEPTRKALDSTDNE